MVELKCFCAKLAHERKTSIHHTDQAASWSGFLYECFPKLGSRNTWGLRRGRFCFPPAVFTARKVFFSSVLQEEQCNLKAIVEMLFYHNHLEWIEGRILINHWTNGQIVKNGKQVGGHCLRWSCSLKRILPWHQQRSYCGHIGTGSESSPISCCVLSHV